jgi:hypothetical protein
MQPDHWRFSLRSLLKSMTIAGAALCLALGSATPALAAPATHGAGGTSAKLVGVVRLIDSTTAEVQAQYTCTGDPADLHLWVSVKQSANGTASPALAEEGTGYGEKAAAWSQGHSGVAQLQCDGRTHVGKFVVDRSEFGYGTLLKGDAYVQFCLFDRYNQQAPVSSMEFLHVR